MGAGCLRLLLQRLSHREEVRPLFDLSLPTTAHQVAVRGIDYNLAAANRSKAAVLPIEQHSPTAPRPTDTGDRAFARAPRLLPYSPAPYDFPAALFDD